jgi:hypothetical protein
MKSTKFGDKGVGKKVSFEKHKESQETQHTEWKRKLAIADANSWETRRSLMSALGLKDKPMERTKQDDQNDDERWSTSPAMDELRRSSQEDDARRTYDSSTTSRKIKIRSVRRASTLEKMRKKQEQELERKYPIGYGEGLEIKQTIIGDNGELVELVGYNPRTRLPNALQMKKIPICRLFFWFCGGVPRPIYSSDEGVRMRWVKLEDVFTINVSNFVHWDELKDIRCVQIINHVKETIDFLSPRGQFITYDLLEQFTDRPVERTKYDELDEQHGQNDEQYGQIGEQHGQVDDGRWSTSPVMDKLRRSTQDIDDQPTDDSSTTRKIKIKRLSAKTLEEMRKKQEQEFEKRYTIGYGEGLEIKQTIIDDNGELVDLVGYNSRTRLPNMLKMKEIPICRLFFGFCGCVPRPIYSSDEGVRMRWVKLQDIAIIDVSKFVYWDELKDIRCVQVINHVGETIDFLSPRGQFITYDLYEHLTE